MHSRTTPKFLKINGIYFHSSCFSLSLSPKIVAFKYGKPALSRRGDFVQWRNEHVELNEPVHPFGEDFPAK